MFYISFQCQKSRTLFYVWKRVHMFPNVSQMFPKCDAIVDDDDEKFFCLKHLMTNFNWTCFGTLDLEQSNKIYIYFKVFFFFFFFLVSFKFENLKSWTGLEFHIFLILWQDGSNVNVMKEIIKCNLKTLDFRKVDKIFHLLKMISGHPIKTCGQVIR